MPFPSEEILERFRKGRREHRLGHAYLLSGADAETLSRLARQLAEVILEAPLQDHPDFYEVLPQSKSRRITVEQMRVLERSLYLKPFKAAQKVAVIGAAERMCLGQAEAANAFLKTLEEPPDDTFLLLWSAAPQVILPTIVSRCLRLDVQGTALSAADPETLGFLKEWEAVKHPHPAIRAYRRSGLLQSHWLKVREAIETEVEADRGDEAEEETVKAAVEGEYQLARQRTLAELEKWYWRQAQPALQKGELAAVQSAKAIRCLEELQQSLQQNVTAELAIERCCLKIEGIIHDL
jgi:DNA polymerase-3 subunit delta'